MASREVSDRSGAARESRNGHFGDGVHQTTIAAAAQRRVHNGMNEHRDIGRFGNDEAIASRVSARLANGGWDNGGDDRGYDPGAWEEKSDD